MTCVGVYVWVNACEGMCVRTGVSVRVCECVHVCVCVCVTLCVHLHALRKTYYVYSYPYFKPAHQAWFPKCCT